MSVPAIALYPIVITPACGSAPDCDPTRPFSSSLSFAGGDDTAAVSLTGLSEIQTFANCTKSQSFSLKMSVPAIALYPIVITPACGSAPDCDPTRPFSSSLSFAGGDDTAAVSLTASCSPSRSFPSPSLLRASAGKDRIFKSFIRNALGSCFDYHDSKSVTNDSEIDLGLEECSFDLEESYVEPYARELLSGAQSRHKIFNEEFVIRAFYEAERAHR